MWLESDLTAYSNYVTIRSMAESLLTLDAADAARLRKAATDSAIGHYRNVDNARGTARWQSGIGLNAALLFGAGAAVLATVASAGVLAPATATLVGLAAAGSGIMTGLFATMLGIGQGRAKLNEGIYKKIAGRHGLRTRTA